MRQATKQLTEREAVHEAQTFGAPVSSCGDQAVLDSFQAYQQTVAKTPSAHATSPNPNMALNR